MTTNAHTHCPTCIEHATETQLEGMAEILMDDEDISYDEAVKRISPEALREQVIEYLDGIIEQQSNTLSTNPSNTCFFVHLDD